MIDSNFERQDFFAVQERNLAREQHRHRQHRFRLIIPTAIAVLAILASAGTFIFLILGKEHPLNPGPQRYSIVTVTFTSSTTYDQALDIVTNLGFQPGSLCSTTQLQPGELSRIRLWQPMGQRETFLDVHHLTIVQSLYAPSDWLQRFHASTGVLTVSSPETTFPSCLPSEMSTGTPTSKVITPLTGAEPTLYAQITFDAPLNDYNAALYTVSNIGLLLADPCYEQALNQANGRTIQYPWDTNPSWHPMSQRTGFNSTHTVVVETVPLITSSIWQSQLRTLSGIKSLRVMSTVSCS